MSAEAYINTIQKIIPDFDRTSLAENKKTAHAIMK